MVLGGTLRLEMLDGRGNFLLAHEAALDALGLAPLGFGEEHVAVAHELLGTGLVEDDARVYVGGDEQPDAVGDVRLDHARDDVARGALGCDDEVDAGGTCELGDAHDRILDVLARDHHEIGELVNDDDDEGHLVGMVAVFVGELALLDHLVVEADVLGTHSLEDLEPALHFGDGPLQGACRLLGLGDWRDEEMRNAVVQGHLDALGVDEYHAHLCGRSAHEYGHDHGVEADRLARTGGAGDEEVRHLRKVDAYLLAVDILADGDLQRTGLAARKYVSEKHARAHLVGNLDAHERGAGNLRDAHGRRGERKGYVVSEVGELGEADAAGELDLEHRDRGTGEPTDDLGRQAELLERLLQDVGGLAQLPGHVGALHLGDAEHARIGQGEALECRGRGTVGDDLRLLDDGHGDIRLGLLHVRCRSRLLPLALSWFGMCLSVKRDGAVGIFVEHDRHIGVFAIEGDRVERIGRDFVVLISGCAGIPAKLCLETRQGRFALIGKGVVICLLIRILRLSRRVDGALVTGLRTILPLAREEVLEREEGRRDGDAGDDEARDEDADENDRGDDASEQRHEPPGNAAADISSPTDKDLVGEQAIGQRLDGAGREQREQRHDRDEHDGEPDHETPDLDPLGLEEEGRAPEHEDEGDDVGPEPERVLERIRYGDCEHGVAGHDDGDEQRDADDGKRDADEVLAHRPVHEARARSLLFGWKALSPSGALLGGAGR